MVEQWNGPLPARINYTMEWHTRDMFEMIQPRSTDYVLDWGSIQGWAGPPFSGFDVPAPATQIMVKWGGVE